MTPALTGTLLPGVTRDSLLTLGRDLGYQVEEGKIAADAWQASCAAGELTEVFACGTAAVITPVGTFRSASGGSVIGDGTPGPVTLRLREESWASSTATAPTRTAGSTRSASTWVIPGLGGLVRAGVKCVRDCSGYDVRPDYYRRARRHLAGLTEERPAPPTRRPLASREGSFCFVAAGSVPTRRNHEMTPDDAFHVYDTTLRDGAQQEGLSLTVADKLAIARRLDEFGVGFIEGGWPGAIPKDTEFFRRARTERSWPRAAGGVSRPAGRTRWRRRPAGRRPARVRRPVVTLVKT